MPPFKKPVPRDKSTQPPLTRSKTKGTLKDDEMLWLNPPDRLRGAPRKVILQWFERQHHGPYGRFNSRKANKYSLFQHPTSQSSTCITPPVSPKKKYVQVVTNSANELEGCQVDTAPYGSPATSRCESPRIFTPTKNHPMEAILKVTVNSKTEFKLYAISFVRQTSNIIDNFFLEHGDFNTRLTEMIQPENCLPSDKTRAIYSGNGNANYVGTKNLDMPAVPEQGYKTGSITVTQISLLNSAIKNFDSPHRSQRAIMKTTAGQYARLCGFEDKKSGPNGHSDWEWSHGIANSFIEDEDKYQPQSPENLFVTTAACNSRMMFAEAIVRYLLGKLDMDKVTVSFKAHLLVGTHIAEKVDYCIKWGSNKSIAFSFDGLQLVPPSWAEVKYLLHVVNCIHQDDLEPLNQRPALAKKQQPLPSHRQLVFS